MCEFWNLVLVAVVAGLVLLFIKSVISKCAKNKAAKKEKIEQEQVERVRRVDQERMEREAKSKAVIEVTRSTARDIITLRFKNVGLADARNFNHEILSRRPMQSISDTADVYTPPFPCVLHPNQFKEAKYIVHQSPGQPIDLRITWEDDFKKDNIFGLSV
jgi:hypothetical protein